MARNSNEEECWEGQKSATICGMNENQKTCIKRSFTWLWTLFLSRKTLRSFKISTPSGYNFTHLCSEKKFKSQYKTLKRHNEKRDYLSPVEKPCANRKCCYIGGYRTRAHSILLTSVIFWQNLTVYRKPKVRKYIGIYVTKSQMCNSCNSFYLCVLSSYFNVP